MDPTGSYLPLATMIDFPAVAAKEKLSKKSILVNSDSPPVMLVMPQMDSNGINFKQHWDFTNLNLGMWFEPTRMQICFIYSGILFQHYCLGVVCEHGV